MLTMPRFSPEIVSIIGTDPGSHNLGVGILVIDIPTMSIVSSVAQTLTGAKLAGKHSWIGALHGDRQGRIFALEDTLLRIFREVQPLEIACESPFINPRNPHAGLALTEVISAIRHAVMQYDIWKGLYLIDPPTVKRAVGAPGNADKTVMKQKVMELADLNYVGSVPLQLLDEHSIDALAVAYARYLRLLEELNYV